MKLGRLSAITSRKDERVTQKIIAFSGKKQAGKSECCKFLIRNAQELFGVPPESVKKYSMADPLKKLCIDVLGLTHEQCYGTEEQKNTLTRYKWEDLPYYDSAQWAGKHMYTPVEAYGGTEYDRRPTGFMTARQVLQGVGTGIFRRMYANIWNEACIRAIKKVAAPVALIDDVRFPDEVQVVQDAGGKVIRLTRNPIGDKPHGVWEGLTVPLGGDVHESELALDPDRYDWKKFDGVVPNHGYKIVEQNLHIVSLLEPWGWLQKSVSAE